MAEAAPRTVPYGGIRCRLSRAAEWLDARLCGADVEFQGVCTDSREPAAGALFVALRGPNHDGHDHIAEAVASGAAAVLVEVPLGLSLSQLVVGDTRRALGRLAAAWRATLDPQVVAVTGSNGKTTVKEMIAAILGQAGAVLATRGNLNNDIGVPLTLLRLEAAHRYGVLELGANHPGEIAYLTGLVRPQVALITNAAPAHLSGFGSLEGVARAKGEIFQGLGADGVAVINADDPHASLWRGLAGPRKVLSFGLEGDADVGARWEGDVHGSRLSVTSPAGPFEIRTGLPGRHNAVNALAACAAALALGLSPDRVRAGLEAMAPVKGRLQLLSGINGARLIDDTYNANPASLRAGLGVLAACPGRRFLVLGDMGELGADAEALHAEAGREARAMGVERLYATGRLSRFAAEAFGSGGGYFPDNEALIAALGADLNQDVTVLIKGSRAMHMEQVAAALTIGGGD